MHFSDLYGIGTVANLVLLLGIYRKVSIIVYQHKLMWDDFAKRKDLNPAINGNAGKSMGIGVEL